VGDLSYRVRGPYFESCNCDAICPCRTVGGVAGGRSTYGVCYGALCWRVDEGRIGEVDVSGLSVALVLHYDDDEPGSPWSVVLHVDAQAGEAQRSLLAELFLGGLGGPHVSRLPWIRKARHLVDVRTSAIELTPEGDGYRLRVGEAVALRATRRVETDVPVACAIPGYDRAGHELFADSFVVDDEPYSWRLQGNCAYAADFDYASG
jgi:Protein of unknown function (DUF1326)